MPVEIYVRSDLQGRPIPAAHSHEIRGSYEIIKQLWLTFHLQDAFYAVVASIEKPSADLIVISERGIGILELKHSFGRISVNSTDLCWYAGETNIKAG